MKSKYSNCWVYYSLGMNFSQFIRISTAPSRLTNLLLPLLHSHTSETYKHKIIPFLTHKTSATHIHWVSIANNQTISSNFQILISAIYCITSIEFLFAYPAPTAYRFAINLISKYHFMMSIKYFFTIACEVYKIVRSNPK